MTIVNYKEFLKLAGARPIPDELGKFDKPITAAQKEMLHKMGIGFSDIDNRYKADIVLSVANYRMKKGLATPGQMRMLRKLGVSDVGKKTFEEASDIIGYSYYW